MTMMNLHINPQVLLVAPLVAACFVYSAWTLVPAAWRRPLATLLARMPWLARLPAITRAARAPTGCGCDGCDRSTAPMPQAAQTAQTAQAPGSVSVIRIVPRRPAA